MSKFYAERKDLKKSGEKVLAWGYSCGDRYPTTKKKGIWCVMLDGKIYAEARGRQKCLDIVDAMNAKE